MSDRSRLSSWRATLCNHAAQAAAARTALPVECRACTRECEATKQRPGPRDLQCRRGGGGGSVRRGRFTSRMPRRVARVYVCVRQIGPERTPGAQLDSSRGVWRLARTCLAVVHGVASCGLCGMAWAMAWDGQPPRRSVPEQQGPHASEGRRGRTAGGLRWLGEWPACARAQRLLSHGDFLPRRQGRRVTRTAVHGAGHGATRLTCHETRVSSHD